MSITPQDRAQSMSVVFEIIDETKPKQNELKEDYYDIAKKRQECFEYRLSWHKKYKNYVKKETKFEKDYESLIEAEDKDDSLSSTILQKRQAIEKRKEKLQKEKQKLEKMKEKDFVVKEIMAMRRLLKEPSADIDISCVVDFSRRR